ncbi:HNH endonuclease [Mycobacterium sp. 3519A]|uniref:HNH endonuclease n=1 Tax=Mycobacterium sp. 3519A TaxID=2057184 RepID=UPI001358DB6C|nr:HNH endonuclease signature motif containing protein [Mycobacterium sp. 3519A]
MPSEIRYRSGGDNGILKLALFDAYRTRCYWCGKPQSDYAAVQIDHIVPSSTKQDDLAKWLPPDRVEGYDLDAPYNLAPICAPCNLKKSNHDVSGFPVVATALHTALAKQEDVIRRAEFFEGPTAIAKFLKTIAAMDFDKSENISMFQEHMTPLVRRLAAIDPAKAHDFDELRTVWVGDPAEGTQQQVSVTLDVRDRRSVVVLEDVCQLTLDDALQQPVSRLRETIVEEAVSALESHEFKDRNEDVTVDEVDGDIDINIDKVGVERHGEVFSFTFGGEFDAVLSGSAVVASADGGSTESLQGDVFANGRFSLTGSWTMGDPECIEAIADIEGWRAATTVWDSGGYYGGGYFG